MGQAMYRIMAQSDSETEWNRRCCPSLPLRVTRPDAAAADGHTDIAPPGRACAQLCFLGDRMESDSAPLCPNIVTRNPVSNVGRTAARRRCWRRRAGAIPPSWKRSAGMVTICSDNAADTAGCPAPSDRSCTEQAPRSAAAKSTVSVKPRFPYTGS